MLGVIFSIMKVMNAMVTTRVYFMEYICMTRTSWYVEMAYH